MKKHTYFIKRTLAFAAAFCLVSGSLASSVFAQTASTDYQKKENVYAKLAADGSASNAYVINTFVLSSASDITDYGNYSEVKNLTDLSALTQKNNSTQFSAEEGIFYYQGTLDEVALPWLISIEYSLDGKEITPENLGGKSGALAILLSLRQNKAVDSVFYDNYLVQISLTLDSANCRNIDAPDATIADVGASQQLTFTVMPGSDADFTIETDVTDFSMSGFSIAAVPYSMSIDIDSFDTDDITDEFSELTDAVAQLSDGTSQLADGVHALSDGGSSLSDGSSQIKDGLLALSGSSRNLTNASYQIGSALDTISRQLNDTDFSSMDSLTQLPAALSQLSDALTQLEDGLTQLYGGFSQSYQALDGAISASAASAPTEAELQALGTVAATSGNTDAQSAYQKLTSSYQSLAVIQGTYAQVKPAFEAVANSLNPDNPESVTAGLKYVNTGLSTMFSSLSSSMGDTDIAGSMRQLQEGLATLASNYSQFHNGLTAYTEGVSSLSAGYTEYHDGLASYLDGVNELDNGSTELADGMSTFYDGVSDIPSQMQTTIDEMMAEYSSSDFEAVSFVDTRNENVQSVQFILSTEGISLPEEEESVIEEKELGFWDRLMALFS